MAGDQRRWRQRTSAIAAPAAGALLLLGCGQGSVRIAAPTRDLMAEVDRSALEEQTRSPSYTMLLSGLGGKIRVGMTADQLRTQMGPPRVVRPELNSPFQGRTSEWHYTRWVLLVKPPEQEPQQVKCRIVVIIRNGRVSTWHEL